MDPLTLSLITAGVGVAGAATKVLGDLADNTGNLLRQQADLKVSTLEENMRRTEGSQTQVLSSTKARMAGTGFANDSASFANYIQTMSTTFDAQNRATHEQGLKSADLIRQGADAADTQKKYRVAGDIFNSAMQIGNMFA